MKKNTHLKVFYSVFPILVILLSQINIYSQIYTNINLTQDPASQHSPVVAISHINPNLVVAAWDHARLGPLRIGYCNSTDAGSTWSANRILDSTLLGGGHVPIGNPSVCTDMNGNFYLAVTGFNSTDYVTGVYKSTNGGVSFTSAVTVLGMAYGSTRPIDIVCDLSASSPFANTIYLVIPTHSISKSTDGGQSWSAPVGTNQGGYGPVIAISPNGQINQLSMYCCAPPLVQDKYHYNSSTDGGLTFNEDIVVDSGYSMNASFSAYFPSIACDISGGPRNGYIYCVTSNGGHPGGETFAEDVYLVRSTDNGATWSNHSRVNIFDQMKFHHHPRVALSNTGTIAIEYFFLVNTPIPSPADAWLARSYDGGFTFSNEALGSVISPESIVGYPPAIDYWGNKVVPLWTDRRDSVNYEIYTADVTDITVSGHVTYKDNGQPVNSGFVKALRYDYNTNNIITVDSTSILPGGLYTLSHYPRGDSLDIMFYQNDDNRDFVPTYYQSTVDWRLAAKVYATGNLSGIDGQVYRINNTDGPYAVSGGTFWNPQQSVMTVLNDVIVYATIGTDYKNYGISRGYGNYLVTKLLPGTYYLTARRIGFDPVSKYVTITNQKVPGIDFIFGNPVTVHNENSNVPKSYMLYQNYPNPFNPETKIKFDIPKEGNVKIIIYDLLGREVIKLADEDFKAGSYSVNWNAADYSSGVYFYRIETEQFTETKKLLLIK